jgi:predicted aldo/keto reductase-like oxidoreductase
LLKKYPRERYHLVDKLPIWLIEREEDVDRYFYEQLEKCGVDRFDFISSTRSTATSIKSRSNTTSTSG